MMDQQQRAPFWRELMLRIKQTLRRVLQPLRPSQRPGMGALPYDGGTTFRVWAPHASDVSVTGSFNGWSHWQHPLASERNGYWSVDVPDVLPGAAYKWVIHHGRRRLLRTDPYAREVTPLYQNSIVRDPYPVQEAVPPAWMPTWNRMVIYELHVGTFGASADGPPADFDALSARIPYLQALGVNVIELMPVAEFPGDFSWGYNPAHPFAVTQTYGGPDALRRFIHAAHAANMAVILDVVYNHFGPDDLSLWQFDGWQQNGKGGIYFYNDWRSTTPWADTRPDYGRGEVRQFLRDNALYWLEEFGFDGLRWDATAYIRNVHGHEGDPGSDIPDGWGLMRWINDEVSARFPWKIKIAEDLRGNAWITKPTGEGGAGFDAQWDDHFVHPIRSAIITAGDGDRDMQAVADALQFRTNGDAFERVVYTESHDEVANGKARVPEEIAPGDAGSFFARKRAALGAALVFTAPGIPMIFQGQEFLEDGWFDDHDPLDWRKAEDNRGTVALYRDLIALRRDLAGQTRGLTGQHIEILGLDNERKLLAFRRWAEGGPGDDVVVVANFANALREAVALPFPAEGTWRLRFNSDRRAYDGLFGDTPGSDVAAVATRDGDVAVGVVSIGPYAVLIYSQDAG